MGYPQIGTKFVLDLPVWERSQQDKAQSNGISEKDVSFAEMGYFSGVTLSLSGKIRLNIKYNWLKIVLSRNLYLDMAKAYIKHFVVNI